MIPLKRAIPEESIVTFATSSPSLKSVLYLSLTDPSAVRSLQLKTSICISLGSTSILNRSGQQSPSSPGNGVAFSLFEAK